MSAQLFRRFASRHFQSGFNLVELMVASAIGMLIMVAILTLYLNMSRANEEMAKTNAIAEAGRSAVQFMQRDLVHAGFWGGFVPDFDDLTSGVVSDDYPREVRDPCLAYSSWGDGYKRDLIASPVQMFSGGNVPANCSSLLSNARAGSDYLVVRHAETAESCYPGYSGCATAKPGELYLQVSSCGDEIEDDDRYVLKRAPSDPSLVVDRFDLKKISCSSSEKAEIRRFSSSIYYVRDYSVSPGDGIPALVRLRFGVVSGVPKFLAEPEVLVEGVEVFRVELGVDNIGDGGYDILATDPVIDRPKYVGSLEWGGEPIKVSPLNRGDGAPDVFVHCEDSDDCDQHDFSNTVAVKLHFLVRSLTVSPGYSAVKDYRLNEVVPADSDLLDDGNYKRNVFSTLVRLNNVSGRRETP